MTEKTVRQTSCYFCNELFDLGKLQIHLQQCGSILEQCPVRCGAWIQRRHKDAHAAECPGLRKDKRCSTPSYARSIEPNPESLENGISLETAVKYLEKELADIRLDLRKEASQHDLQLGELENLKAKFVLAEDKSQHFLAKLVGLQSMIDEELQSTSVWSAQFKHDIANLQLVLQEMQSAQISLTMRIDSVISALGHEQQEREHFEQLLISHDRKLEAIDSFETQLQTLRESLQSLQESESERRQTLAVNSERSLAAEAQIAHVSALRAELNQQAIVEQYMAERHQLLEVECKNLRADITEVSNTIHDMTKHVDNTMQATGTIARDLKALSKSYFKLRDDFNGFKQEITFRDETQVLGSDDGHLIWRIDDFTTKMKNSREHGAVLTGPLFRTSKYGYTLKAELYLNGIGKWKGKYVTATVRLVEGPYDPILEWPCDLLVNIVVKDQAKVRNQAVDIVKSLHIRKKTSKSEILDTISQATSVEEIRKSIEDLASASTAVELKRKYVFIPHHSLDKFDYTKDNVLFLEFCVKQ